MIPLNFIYLFVCQLLGFLFVFGVLKFYYAMSKFGYLSSSPLDIDWISWIYRLVFINSGKFWAVTSAETAFAQIFLSSPMDHYVKAHVKPFYVFLYLSSSLPYLSLCILCLTPYKITSDLYFRTLILSLY